MKKLLLLAAAFSGMVLLHGCDSNTSSSTPQFTVTLSASPAEGGSVSAAEQVYDEGSVATIAATPAGEWMFVRWEGDFTGTSSASTFTVDSDKNITAVFEKRSYALTVNTSGEGTVDEQIVQTKSTDYESGTVVELTGNPAQGWEFKEWTGAISDTASTVQVTIDDPKQITAIFTEITESYTVTLTPSPAEGGSVSAASQVYTQGSVATISATPASEWEFVRWEGDFTGTSSTSTLTVDSDKNITAIFEKRNYALTVNTSGNGDVDEQIIQAKTTNYESGTVVELTANPGTGWGFVRWEGAITGNNNPVQITVDDPMQVTAVFEPFYLDVNGVTVRCGAAEVGQQGFVNGILYTKRTAQQITVDNAASTCTSGIVFMSNLFDGISFFAEDISTWDVSSVTTMNGMFRNANFFESDLNNWDVTSVTDMSEMFSGTLEFFDDISSWDVSSVTDMNSMFSQSSLFNNDLSNWDVSSVTNMSNMFLGATSFNSDISGWDVGSVTNMESMFRGAEVFDQDLSSWNVSSATNMRRMFFAADSFNSDLSSWNVSSVTNLNGMFISAESFNSNLNSWDVSSVTDMGGMFSGADSFNSDLSSWDVSSVTDMGSMFNDVASFNSDLSNWNVSSVTSMGTMFSSATSFNADISSWDVSNVTDFAAMFVNATSFNADLSNWDVSSATNMTSMFINATSFNIDISSWDVSNVTEMNYMFSGASSFNQDIGVWDVSNVTMMLEMFENASIFNQDLSGWCVTNITTEPGNFSTGSPLQNSFKPVWGTCPGS